MLVWPHPLCLEHARLAPGLTAFAGLFVLAGACVVLRPRLAFPWLWIAVALAPYLHVIAFAHTSPVADRYLYAASAGFCLFLGELADFRRGPWALAALAVVWGASAFARNLVMMNEGALAEQTAAGAPDSAPAQIMLGNFQLREGLDQDAKASFTRALAIDGSLSVAWSNLGIAEYMLGDYDASVAAFRKAIASGDAAVLHYNLGNALAAKKLFREAAAEYDRAASLQPGYQDAITNAAIARRLATSAPAPRRRAGPSLP